LPDYFCKSNEKKKPWNLIAFKASISSWIWWELV